MTTEEEAQPVSPSQEYRWIPTMDMVPGMMLARPVLGGPGNRVTLRIAVGSSITADTIAQLINKGVECVAVYQDTPIDEAALTAVVQCYEDRLAEIFGPQPNESCLRLLRALQAGGPLKC